MTGSATATDKFRAILVLAATLGTIAFNWLAADGSVGGVTPADISARYLTPATPADYSFAIWTLIYFGMLVFGIYQLLPSNLVRFRKVRSLYILSCALNCGWIFVWVSDQIVISFVLIILLTACLLLINLNLRTTGYWTVKAPFEVYFGWVTAAAFVNSFVLLKYLNVELSATGSTVTAVALILLAGLVGVLVRLRLTAHLYPLAIAWALTAIAVKQSGQTLIIVACATGVVACLIATLSFVVNLPSSSTRENPPA
ncbi:MAG TPA: hypothetical protein VJL58_12435 [Pyrinomonadaceae bacterium]|nr:hypothetical protein [Pyrinomonadaceae bacterium]